MKRAVAVTGLLFGIAVLGVFAGGAWAQQPAPQNPPPSVPPEAQQPGVAPADANSPAAKPPAQKVVVPSGTRLPLVLHNSITTRNARPGDGVYLETLFPITQDNHIVIPAGSYVKGEILEAKRQ